MRDARLIQILGFYSVYLKIGDACDLRAWRELYFKYWIANNIDSARFLPLWCTFEHTSNYIIYIIVHYYMSKNLNH
jgi:hypothetical protein